VRSPAQAQRSPEDVTPGRLRYMPGVDGLRAIAVAAVIAYHLGAGWLPGGFLGVDVFLVISGFLITSLLLAERQAKGKIDLKRFWTRRALRLLPALFLMLVVVLAAMVIIHPGEVGRLRGAVLASLGYVANWYFAFADVPYFEQFGRPSVLQHLWSLAVEEQFYILWPPILALALISLRLRWLMLGIVAAIAGSTVLSWLLWEPFADPSRIYYGTDTRAVGLLVGVLLALVWPAARTAKEASPQARAILDGAGAVCLAALAFGLLTLGDLDERLYRGGLLAVALATAGLVAVAAHPASRLGKALGNPVMVWIGLRSYGIYLWHWPVVMLTRPDVDIPLNGPLLVLLRLGLTVGAAALSYTYFERPIRRAGLTGTWQAITGWLGKLDKRVRLAAESGVTAAFVALVLLVAFLPRTTPNVPGLTDVASAAQATTPVVDPDPPTPEEDARAARRRRVLLVGDSVMLGAAPILRQAIGRKRAVIDATVARQFPEGAETVRARLRRMPNAAVVIHLGSNGYVKYSDLHGLLKDLSKRPRVVLVTVRVPLEWQDPVNALLRHESKRFDNVRLADWYAVSGGSGLLVDGAHATPKGQRIYARTIAAQLR
jgi:peptidoglycan/LPS O-acetylase OafA/YrhL